MKRLDKIESDLLDYKEALKPSLETVVNNIGKIIAIICCIITLIVTFTDVSFSSLGSKDSLPTLLLLLVSSYIIYFSLEDAGEKLGIRSEEYISAKKRYDCAREKIKGEDIGRLRSFLDEYCKEELEYRRSRLLLSEGLTAEELSSYLLGEKFEGRKRRALRRIAKCKPKNLTPQLLLGGASVKGLELEPPTKGKLLGLILKLIPSTVCMTVTVSVMLSVKGDMTASDALTALIKLSAIPAVGFRGYSQGYIYAKINLTDWNRTRAEIIEAFLKTQSPSENA